MAKAIEIFEVTLTTPDSPFDRYLKGNRKALSAKEKRVLQFFWTRAALPAARG